MEFINQEGKIAVGKALYQTLQTQTPASFTFNYDNREDAEEMLLEYYRREMRKPEENTEIVKGHISEVIDWAMDAKKSCLMLAGGVGCGKTTMLNAFCKMTNFLFYSNISYERRGFQWETANTISEWARNNKERYEEFMKCEWAAIDDLGLEAAEVSDYGTILYPIRDILMYRYEHNLITVVSTNYLPQELTEKYGTRIGDRLAEMMQIVLFKESSYRR